MTSVLKEVIKYVAALMSFCTLIYLIVIVLDWFSLTNPLDSKNPVTIYGYTCFAHLLSIPMLLYAVLKYKFNYLFPFILVNFFWITIIVTLTTLIYTGVFGIKTRLDWRGNDIHQVLMLLYFLLSVAMQGLSIAHFFEVRRSSAEVKL